MSRPVAGCTAVLDANVLYPFRVRDVALRFAEVGLFRPRWSARILKEWTRSLLARRPELADSISAQLTAMATAFPEAMARTGAIPHDLALPDPDDRHVVATALATGAAWIVTENLADFPTQALAAFGVTAIGADGFLTALFGHEPERARVALERARAAYRAPPMTPEHFAADMEHYGLTALSQCYRHA